MVRILHNFPSVIWWWEVVVVEVVVVVAVVSVVMVCLESHTGHVDDKVHKQTALLSVDTPPQINR